ncbi:MAG: hypothetical protein ACXWE9_10675 [Methylobacter sp.]
MFKVLKLMHRMSARLLSIAPIDIFREYIKSGNLQPASLERIGAGFMRIIAIVGHETCYELVIIGGLCLVEDECDSGFEISPTIGAHNPLSSVKKNGWL